MTETLPMTYPTPPMVTAGDGEAHLMWTPPDECTEQRIYLNQDTTPYGYVGGGELLATLPAMADRHTVTGLQNGTAYGLQVAVPRDYGFGECEERSAITVVTPGVE